MRMAVTGHRPKKLGWGYDYSRPEWYALSAMLMVHMAHSEPEEFISGGALGVDQVAAITALSLDIPLVLALPFPPAVMSLRWTDRGRDDLDRLVVRASRVEVIAEEFSYEAFQERNVWMVDRCDELVAVYQGGMSGGTANCLAYAAERGVPVTEIHPREVEEFVESRRGEG